MKNEIIVRCTKKEMAKHLNLTPPAVVQWFATNNVTLPTADKVWTLYKEFGIPVDYWANPNLYEVKFIPKKRNTSRVQKEHNDNAKV